MGSKSSGLAFAVVGHQDSWDTVMKFVNTLRINEQESLPIEKVQQTFSYIPPRKIFDIEVNSILEQKIGGAYVETFISPDELDIKYLRKNIEKVKQACEACAKLNVKVASLGGFSSIVLETGNAAFTQIQNTFFTTGNTLTAAFITRGIENACAFWQQPLPASKLLIIGSTGDIGSACALYFADKVQELLLCARQETALQNQSNYFTERNIANKASVHLKTLVGEADIIISVASSIINENDFKGLDEDVIICDAGYPKNLQSKYIKHHTKLFYGGMGFVTAGYAFENNLQQVFYQFPLNSIGHGCLLEAVVLALEDKPCSFSAGRGNITPEVMQEMLLMAKKHGIVTAPLFNKVLVNATAAEILY